MTPQRAPEELLGQIQSALDELGLTEMHDALDERLADTAPDLTRLEWLWLLIEPQARGRRERRIERRIREARLPARKTLSEFEFEFQPKLDRDLVVELATLRFVQEGKNLLLAGMSGTGKTHIALALGLLACMANRRVLYTTSADMLAHLNASLADNTLAEALKDYTRPDLLLLDEVGLEQVERRVASHSGLMQKVLFPRYQARRSTIITSNIPWDAWGEYLDDHLGATAILDRLIHNSHIVVIDGPSYRERAHRLAVEERQAEKKKGRARN